MKTKICAYNIKWFEYQFNADNSLKTVNFKVGEVGSHYNMTNGIKNFDFNFYQHVNANPNPVDGGFYSNDNNQDPNNITYFIFSKKTSSNKIIASFFENLITLNPFDLTISQKVDIMSTFYFKIDSIESFHNYYKYLIQQIYHIHHLHQLLFLHMLFLHQ